MKKKEIQTSNSFSVSEARQLFKANENVVDAPIMKGYMRGQFEFFGIKKPLRRALGKQLYKAYGAPTITNLPELIQELWRQPERELHYLGNDLWEKHLNKLPAEYIHHFEWCILHKSWWDTVDTLAIRVIGSHFGRYPELIVPMVNRFVNADNLWLNRVSIIFQLKYKTTTNVDMLFRNIRQHETSEAFFIQKAIGWALREYSKTDADTVIDFVKNTPLAPFSKKEALKWLKNNDKL